MGSQTPGSGFSSVRVPIKPDIIRYKTPMPTMTTRLTITVQKTPFLVFFRP